MSTPSQNDGMSSSGVCHTCHNLATYTPVPSADASVPTLGSHVDGVCHKCHNWVKLTFHSCSQVNQTPPTTLMAPTQHSPPRENTSSRHSATPATPVGAWKKKYVRYYLTATKKEKDTVKDMGAFWDQSNPL